MNLNLVSEPVLFLTEPNYFWGIVAGTNLWKELGWNTILYLAAITAIDPSLYEAAEVDGAGRYRKMFSITLPSIRPTIVVLLIINSGWILSTNFELPYFLGNGLVSEKAETIDVFVLRYGYQLGNYSLAVVAGIFKTIVAIILVGLGEPSGQAPQPRDAGLGGLHVKHHCREASGAARHGAGHGVASGRPSGSSSPRSTRPSCVILAALMVYPLLNTLAISLNDGMDAVRGGIGIWPSGLLAEELRRRAQHAHDLPGVLHECR